MRLKEFTYFVLVFYFSLQTFAYAYIEPGTFSMIISFLVAIIASITFFIKDMTIGMIFQEGSASSSISSILDEDKIKFLDAWVHKDHRRKGIFRKLWDIRWNFVQQNYKGYKAYAWCKPMSLPLLIEKGFKEGETCVYVEKIIE